MQNILCLMGPTATGKTRLAMELLNYLPCEIISVDSAMVYRGMDIGTAKPTIAEQKIAPHRLLDICDPKDVYSAGQFRSDALREIKNILQQGKIPLLVGGTMLYFHVLQQGIANLPTANVKVRQRITERASIEGWEQLHKHLSEVDPESAVRIHPNDSQRIARALEIYELTGKTFMQIANVEKKEDSIYSFINLAVAPQDRAIIHERVQTRFANMLQQGFIAEVEQLYRRSDLNRDLPSIRAVGYRQTWDYFDNLISFNEMQEKIVIATRQLAKRQLTWLRGWKNITWFDSEALNLVETVLLHVQLNMSANSSY